MAQPRTPRPTPEGTGKTAFVTGGTGFLGLNLVEQLCAAGWQVTCAHRAGSDTSGLAKFPVALRRAALNEPEELAGAMPEGADAVFHLAGNTSVWSRHNAQQMRDNIDGTRNVLGAAEKRGAKRVVHTSSWSVYGDHGITPIHEDSQKRGELSWINYERTKYYGELCALAANADGLPTVILNPTHVMGRYDTRNWARMIVLADRGKLPGVPPGNGVFAHAEAVARAHIAAAEKGRPGENYILGGPAAPFVDVVGLIGEMLGRKVPRRPLPAWLLKSVARVQTGIAEFTGREPDITPEAAELVCRRPGIDTDKAERELDYRCPDLRTQLADSIEWLRGAGMISNRERAE